MRLSSLNPAFSSPLPEKNSVQPPASPVKFGAGAVHQDFQDAFSVLAVDENTFVKNQKGKPLGRGTQASVWEIACENLQKYVLCIPGIGARPRKLEVLKDPLFNLPEGGPIAKIGNVEVLKRVPGVPAGVGENFADAVGVEEASRQYTEKLSHIAAMPQRAFDVLARKLVVVNKAGFRIDPDNGTNIHIEPGKAFYLVDLSPIPKYSGYTDTLSELSRLLMSYTFACDTESTAEMETYRNTILAKCIQAAKKTRLPLPEADDWGIINCFDLAGKPDEWPKVRQSLLNVKPLYRGKRLKS